MSDVKNIFPHEIVEFSVEKHFQDSNPRSRIVYLVVLGILFVSFIMLFIVRVDVSVLSAGLIRPVQERTEIRAPVNGIVDSVFISENMHVVAGQPLFKIHSGSVDERNLNLNSQSEETSEQIADLKNLLAGNDSGLQSQLYQQQHMLYEQKLNDARIKYDVVRRNYDRYAQLYHSRAISPAEFDKYDFEMKTAENDLKLVKEQQFSQWQGDLTRLGFQQRDMSAQKTMYKEQADLYTVRAATTGTVQQFKGIQRGSFVTPGDALGEVSPDTGLIAETYVSTKDIALLHKNTPVRMQVDAFDYNIWGMLTGKVLSISDDIVTMGGRPYFKVRSSLDKNYLKLRNGFKGTVKKGMTIQSRYVVTRRTLFQLLYDQTDDWLNPNIIRDENQTKGDSK